MILRLILENEALLGFRRAIKGLLWAVAEHNVQRIFPRIVRILPHDREAFTQGLTYYKDYLYESTGLIGQSSLRQIRLSDGSATSVHLLDQELFAEGIAILDGLLYQLTWKSGKAIVYDAASLRAVKEVPYKGEGWGLTATLNCLIMSDGSSKLTFHNEDFKILRRHRVTSHGIPLRHINDIEWAHGKVYANILNSHSILEINGSNGRLDRIIDCSTLLTLEQPKGSSHVLNGIAYKEDSNTFFLTGKCWEHLYEVEFPT
jgi:glutaminyl-peptide cyclotransferase